MQSEQAGDRGHESILMHCAYNLSAPLSQAFRPGVARVPSVCRSYSGVALAREPLWRCSSTAREPLGVARAALGSHSGNIVERAGSGRLDERGIHKYKRGVGLMDRTGRASHKNTLPMAMQAARRASVWMRAPQSASRWAAVPTRVTLERPQIREHSCSLGFVLRSTAGCGRAEITRNVVRSRRPPAGWWARCRIQRCSQSGR